MMRFSNFTECFRRATRSEGAPDGCDPYRYQVRLAEEGFPDALRAPTGSGKTAVVLAYVWRLLFHPDASVRAATPRRLVVLLPSRTLVEQYEETVRGWLDQLGLLDAVGVHVLMGGRDIRSSQQDWRMNLHRPSIVIGTIDMGVSRGLARGYGTFRASYPIDFALIGNGALVVVDEVQLAPQATATLRQFAAFQRELGTAEPSRLMIMSATIDERVLDTVDNPWEGADVLGIDESSESPELLRRMSAERTIREFPPVDKPKEFAAQIIDRHKPGTLTLVVVNTVDAAVDAYREVGTLAPDEPRLLIHSQFRGVERKAQLEKLRGIARDGGIVVATQAIEAGVDIDARTLITEAAPWASVVQRAGRCNRAARYPVGEAVVHWRESATGHPYDSEQVACAVKALRRAEGMSLTSAQLHRLGDGIPPEDLELRILRRCDFRQLFDTTPDLTGNDIDISCYIRPDKDLDVQLAWIPNGSITSQKEPRGELTTEVPGQPLRCGVSMSRAKKLLNRKDVRERRDQRAWTFSVQDDRWIPVRADQLRPQQLILVEAGLGGYSIEHGFDPTEKHTVQDHIDVDNFRDVTTPESVTSSQDAGARGNGWVTLHQHLADTREQVEALATALRPVGIDDAYLHAAAVAGALHDLGKAHRDWAQALLDANTHTPPDDPEQLYAKSPGTAPLRVRRELMVDGQKNARAERRFGFRHELISVFMLRTDAGRQLLIDLGVEPELHPLVLYLIAAHHGHIRITARDPRYDGVDGPSFLGCVDKEPINAVTLPGIELPESVVDHGIFRSGPDSWTTNALVLLERLGPFRLAYLETLVRMADWRASATLELPAAEGIEE
jgi:CRISPR-associated helicase cas3